MPTTLNNQANITYDYTGAVTPETVGSNTVATTLLDEYSMTATKTPLSSTFRPGDNVTYTIEIENNGLGDLYNLQVIDNLGSDTSVKPLTFLNAILYLNNVQTPITPTTAADNSIIFSLPSPFTSGSAAIIIYNATVARDTILNSITNTLTVTANGGSSTGAVVTVNPNPTATITAANYAQLSITKQSDKNIISSGDTLTYTFNLTNTGNEPATNVVLTDTLPQNFTITQVSVTTGGSTVVYSASDYNLDTSSNTITLPNTTGTPITVPAATTSGAGLTVVQITGTVSV